MVTSLGPQFDPQYGDGLYHGTHHEIKGGEVLPAAQTEHLKTNFGRMGSREVAYATESESRAWELAHSAVTRNVRKAADAGRTRVHRVKPNPEMEKGAYHPDHPNFMGENLAEWTAPKFDIEEDINVKPGHQGTFNLNWNQFARKDADFPWEDRFNHPDDDVIEVGHTGGKMWHESNMTFWGMGSLEELEKAKQEPLASAPEQGRLW